MAQSFNIVQILLGLESIYFNQSKIKPLRLLAQNLNLHVDKSLEKENLEKFIIILLLQLFLNWQPNDDKTEDHFIKNLCKSISLFPLIHWNDVLSQGQIKSKLWLISELKKINKPLGITFVCAGWVGLLPALMLKFVPELCTKIRSFDIDPLVAPVADSINKFHLNGWKFKASTYDIHNIDYNGFNYNTLKNNGTIANLYDIPDTIINTSCEHIDNFEQWFDKLPQNKLLVLQNNNFAELDDQHLNTVNSIDEFKYQCPMSNIIFEGTLELLKYNRFMLIGYK